MPVALVTGGAGRIGTQVCALLAQAGYRVRAFDLPRVVHQAALEVPEVDPIPGDLTQPEDVRAAAAGVDVAVHLAALLPPLSEQDRARTMAVNVAGTRTLIEALAAAAPGARLVFSSSVVVYGDTTSAEPPVTGDRPLRPLDIYAESKVAAEAAVRASGLAWSILRVSGVAVAEVLEPPDPWPFTRAQRIEFVLREDVAQAVALAAQSDRLDGRVVHVSGGNTWRMTGERYALDYWQALGLPEELATFRESSLAFDWYAPSEALTELGFGPTPYPEYLQRLQSAVAAYLEDAET